MDIKTLEYAKLNLDAVAVGYTTSISQGNLYIEFANGRNLKIADDEVLYQASEFLKSEIQSLEF